MKQTSTETDCARSIRCSVVMIRTTYLIGSFKPLFVNRNCSGVYSENEFFG